MLTKQASAQLSLHTTVKLASGFEMPHIGLGVYQVHTSEIPLAISTALTHGYRHIDTATAYRNESACVTAMLSPFPSSPSPSSPSHPPLPRSALFYTTKLPPKFRGYEQTYNSISATINENPGLEGYIDLYLIHAPYGGAHNRLEQWRAMRDSVREGKIRSIGVSNYSVAHLEELSSWIAAQPGDSGGVISVGQWEVHPWLPRHDILEYCHTHNIAVQAYSPLVRGTRFGPQAKGVEGLNKLAEKYGKTPAQILIRWSLQMGLTPLPKSVHPARIAENIAVFGWELEEDEVLGLDTGGYEPCTWDPSRDCLD
ncbi:NADP-dependent oxidoreductase domain-containing protein [Peziza echinospora]|nr:NADP-dependent oxidoreductase domain-containing protein [Peziza echinospora]